MSAEFRHKQYHVHREDLFVEVGGAYFWENKNGPGETGGAYVPSEVTMSDGSKYRFAKGDLITYSECVWNTTTTVPTLVVPTGYTNIMGNSGLDESGTRGWRHAVSIKIADGTEFGTQLRGMPVPGASNGTRMSIINSFGMSRPIRAVVAGGGVASGGGGAPAVINIPSVTWAADYDLIMYLAFMTGGTLQVPGSGVVNMVPSPQNKYWAYRGWNSAAHQGGFDGVSRLLWTLWTSYIPGEATGAHAVNMIDTGQVNSELACWLKLT
jgi:hypothetical protein